MNQITLTLQNAVDRVGHIPGNLGHPQAIGDRPDAGDLHLAGRQLDEEQNHKPLQTVSGPHLHREEICRHQQFPMLGQEFLSGRLLLPFRRGLGPVSFQYVGNRAACHLVSQITECAWIRR